MVALQRLPLVALQRLPKPVRMTPGGSGLRASARSTDKPGAAPDCLKLVRAPQLPLAHRASIRLSR